MSQLFPAPRSKSKQFTVTMPEFIIEEIDRRSSAQSLSKSAYVRLALLEYFKKGDSAGK